MTFRSSALLRGAALVLACGAAACAGPPPACAPSTTRLPVPVTVAGPALQVAASQTAPSDGAPRESPCWAKGRPAARPVKSDSSMCDAFDQRVMARVEARIRKDLVITEKPSKLIIDYGCDAAWGPVRDVFFEDGSGHGGSLRIVRFRVESDRILVRSIGYSHYYGKGMEVRTGDLDLHALDKMLPTARVAMLARPHVVRLQALDGSIGLGSFSTSSNDFHLRLSIVDNAGRVTDGDFTGYDGSAAQEQIVPMRIATEAFEKLLDVAPLKPVPVSDEDRELLTARFLVTMEREPYWWIKERYVALTALLGTVDAVPALATIVTATKKARAGASEDRAREAAIDAIAAITGWDARIGPRGAVRPLPEAALAIAEKCAL